MISWTAGLVAVMWQSSWGWVIASVRNENGTGSPSPGCGSRREKSIVRPFSRGGRAGLEPAQLEAECPEAAGEPLGRRVARAAPGGLDLAGMHQRLQKRAGRQHDRPRPVFGAAPAAEPGDPATLGEQGFHHLLAERQVLLPFDGQLGQKLVGFLVALGARAVHRGAFAPVQQAELDRSRVGEHPHRAPEGVDLADDLPLGHAADGRVAAHLADGVAVDRQQGGPQTHPGRRQSGFNTGMARADHDHVVAVRVAFWGGHHDRTWRMTDGAATTCHNIVAFWATEGKTSGRGVKGVRPRHPSAPACYGRS